MGERYDCIMLDQKKEYLHEAVVRLRLKDAKKAFERLNTGRARGKVVEMVIGFYDDKYEEVPSCYMTHTVFAKWFSKSDCR